MHMFEVNDGIKTVGCWITPSDSEQPFLGCSGSNWISNCSPPEHGFLVSLSSSLPRNLLDLTLLLPSDKLSGYALVFLWAQGPTVCFEKHSLQTSGQTEFWLFQTLCTLSPRPPPHKSFPFSLLDSQILFVLLLCIFLHFILTPDL